jgi:hypothetical protein
MEENSIRRDWKSGKDLERCWNHGPEHDPVKILCGSPVPLKKGREVGSHFRDEKREYLKDKINELAKQ